ncbi:SKP1-like protein 14 [Capsicum annuum]|uniref:SKP1-like protein 14 n=1 Tax=Capsicum annuum TaxID=4072 RepID=A0A2G2Y3N4_CAPAN|nr:SKP1-like protein 14 [Capsicum annuum]KAF3650726.1 SKP1-like protein 14 [Capsicum annuum]PHT64309.1 SKP1-like protein 14 [Capsicum annuum]
MASSSEKPKSKILILKSSDEDEFEIEESIAIQSVADKIKNKSVKAVRKIFNITNDYTPEEEAKVYEEHKWAHEEGKEHIDESPD